MHLTFEKGRGKSASLPVVARALSASTISLLATDLGTSSTAACKRMMGYAQCVTQLPLHQSVPVKPRPKDQVGGEACRRTPTISCILDSLGHAVIFVFVSTILAVFIFSAGFSDRGISLI